MYFKDQQNIIFNIKAKVSKKYFFLASDFFEKDNKYDVFKARNSCCVKGIFSLLIHIYHFFRNKSNDSLYLYIKNLENLHLNQFFETQHVFVLAGREWILCCRKIVKCAVFKISDLQIYFSPFFQVPKAG